MPPTYVTTVARASGSAASKAATTPPTGPAPMTTAYILRSAHLTAVRPRHLTVARHRIHDPVVVMMVQSRETTDSVGDRSARLPMPPVTTWVVSSNTEQSSRDPGCSAQAI